MTRKALTNFRIDRELLDALDELNARVPEGVSYHVRQAIREYLDPAGRARQASEEAGAKAGKHPHALVEAPGFCTGGEP